MKRSELRAAAFHYAVGIMDASRRNSKDSVLSSERDCRRFAAYYSDRLDPELSIRRTFVEWAVKRVQGAA